MFNETKRIGDFEQNFDKLKDTVLENFNLFIEN